MELLYYILMIWAIYKVVKCGNPIPIVTLILIAVCYIAVESYEPTPKIITEPFHKKSEEEIKSEERAAHAILGYKPKRDPNKKSMLFEQIDLGAHTHE